MSIRVLQPNITYVRNKATLWAGCTRSFASGVKCHFEQTDIVQNLHPIMTYACVVFAHTKIDPLRKSKTNSSAWHLDAHGTDAQIVVLHKDFWLESLTELSHSNQQSILTIMSGIIKACQYVPYSHPLLRRLRGVLLDHDDPITAANAQYIGWRRRGQSYQTARRRDPTVETHSNWRTQSIPLRSPTLQERPSRTFSSGASYSRPSPPGDAVKTSPGQQH